MAMELVFGALGGAVFGLAVAAAISGRETPPIPPAPAQMTLGEVTSLIDRLKPLSERPNEDWRGVSVTITGASAKVEIHTKDGNQYTGKGPTLEAAVKMIDSTKIRDALQGWKP